MSEADACTQQIEIPGGLQHRFVASELAVVAEGVLRATLSSETAVERSFGSEVLDHSLAAVNLDRAIKGLSLLIDHDQHRQLGRVENIRLEGRKLIGEIRLSDRADLAGIVADIRSGLRPDISIGYTIEAAEELADRLGIRATRWTLVEVSSVAVPADHTVGIGREFETPKRRTLTVTTTTNTPPQGTNGADPVQTERARIQNIRAAGERLNLDAGLVTRAIDDGWTMDQLADKFRTSSAPANAMRNAEHPVDEQFDQEKGRFSLTRAIADIIDKGRLTGREAEISTELVKRNGGMAPKGFLFPTALLGTRTQLVGTAGIGGNLVGTQHMGDKFISPLRNRSAVMMLGATVLNDLVGNAALPRQDNATGGTWVAEDAAASETTLNFTQVSLSPKTVTGNISWSRQAALQAQPAMEEIVRGDISAQLGIALDRAAINGAGSSTEPRGILNQSGIGSVIGGANGAAPDYDDMLALEAAVANENADGDAMGYLTNTAVRKVLKGTPVFTGGDVPIWAPGGESYAGIVNGYRAMASNNVPSDLDKGTSTGVCSAIIFGNWSDLLIGLWGAVDLIVDPYTYSDKGRVRISGFLSADINVKHPESFAAMQDALTA